MVVGNLSYADLITKAIQSSAEKRLTLSQIYDWMVQNVGYFRDKGDSNSSAGWKVSILSHGDISCYFGSCCFQWGTEEKPADLLEYRRQVPRALAFPGKILITFKLHHLVTKYV